MTVSNPAFGRAWGLYRDWTLAASARKAAQSRWQVSALALGMAGAALGALASVSWGTEGDAPEYLSVLAGIVVGATAVVGQQVIASTKEREWYRARAIAENLKSHCMLFAAGVPPYDGTEQERDAWLRQASAEIVAKGKDIPAARASEEERREGLPADLPWTAESYCRHRVDDQIRWYVDRARGAGATVRKCGAVTLAAGVLGSVCAGVGQQFKYPVLGACIPVLATVGAFVAAYLYAGRHAFLETSYTAAANQLDDLVAAWRSSGKGEDDREARAAFIASCEAVLMAENGAWVAEYGREPKDSAASKAT